MNEWNGQTNGWTDGQTLKLNFLKVKFILISIPTIYLSYSYNPVATNTNL